MQLVSSKHFLIKGQMLSSLELTNFFHIKNLQTSTFIYFILTFEVLSIDNILHPFQHTLFSYIEFKHLSDYFVINNFYS